MLINSNDDDNEQDTDDDDDNEQDTDDADEDEQDTGGELEGRPLLVPLRPSCPVNRRHRVITPSRLQLYQRT